MPHVSRQKLDSKTLDELERYLSSVFRDTGTKTRVRIFRELLTKTEKIMLAKRVALLFLLKKGLSTYKASELLGISPSTAERYERAFQAGKYRYTTDWVWKNSSDGSFDVFMETLLRLAFTGRTRSFKDVIDEL